MTEAKLAANRRNSLLSPHSGRPLGSLDQTSLYKKEIKRVITEMVYKKIGAMTQAQIAEAVNGSTMAYVALLDRSIDKPVQGVEMTGKDGNPIVFMPLELMNKYQMETHEPLDVNQDAQIIESEPVKQLENGSTKP